jgi:2-octaprenyl-3-methyl-6-methoxy-1,4-benzoquinol hydroxylase
MIGASLAVGLADLGFSVAIVERTEPEKFDPKQPPDMRVSAVNIATEQLLQRLGAWRFIKAMRICQYNRLSVWERSDCRTDFSAQQLAASHLGHIIENRVIQLGLHQRLAECNTVSCFYGHTIQAIDIRANSGAITLASGECLEAGIIVGADGAQSMVRQVAGIGTTGWQYSQQALGISVRTMSPQQDITWQQFTPYGPLAYLPLYDGFGSLVWYNSPKQIKALKSLPHSQLKAQILSTFPKDLVDFEILEMANFPLTRMHANQYIKGRSVLLGDAAHTINPLAGQGMNLGFKDVNVFLQALNSELDTKGKQQALAKPADWLVRYEKARRADNLLMMSAMDGLYLAFGNDNLPLSFMRNLGLRLANSAGPLKRHALKYAMGIKS